MSFSDFGQPVGMKMNSENRWVKKAELIPWDEIEKRYAALFKNRKGNVAKALRLALGALIVQTEYGYSDEETVLQIQEGPYLQYFCGLPEYKDEPPFEASTMVYFRKRLTAEILGEINELIIRKAEEPPKPQGVSAESAPADAEKDTESDHTSEQSKDNEDDGGNSPPAAPGAENGGTLIVDATCAPSNIRYPQDISLLNEGREKLEGLIDGLYGQIGDGEKPRTYRKNAHKDYLHVARKKKKTVKELHKGIGKQLRYMERDFGHIGTLLERGGVLDEKQEEQLQILRTLYEQQRTMYDTKTHQIADRIVSISQPWLRPIVRGKVQAPVEFGAKLDISISGGYVRLEHQSFDAYNESENLREVIERYRERTGKWPERVLADKIYRNRANLAFCKERHIRLSGPALGRPPKQPTDDKKAEYRDNCDRVEVERAFGHAKQKFGLGLIRSRLKNTTRSAIALAIVALNLARIWRVFPLWLLHLIFGRFENARPQKWAFVQ